MTHHYLKWDEKIITDLSDQNITALYNNGYLFGRVEKGEMYQTRSLRIDLDKFSLSSENRRILRKTEGVKMSITSLPYSEYHWQIGKLAKDFYDTKFGAGTFSANKVKELLTEPEKSNFTHLFIFTCHSERSEESLEVKNRSGTDVKGFFANAQDNKAGATPLGYCISFITDEIVHYCYPFYSLDTAITNAFPSLGLGMMTKAIASAKEQGKKYIYLGSASRPTDTYKLQFEGLEWFDGKQWQTDEAALKKILKV